MGMISPKGLKIWMQLSPTKELWPQLDRILKTRLVTWFFLLPILISFCPDSFWLKLLEYPSWLLFPSRPSSGLPYAIMLCGAPLSLLSSSTWEAELSYFYRMFCSLYRLDYSALSLFLLRVR